METYNESDGTESINSWQLDTLTGRLTISGTGKLHTVAQLIDVGKCYLVKEIVVEQGITALEQATFAGSSSIYQDTSYWSALKKVTLPDGITMIPGGTFYNCPELEEVIIPYGVEAVGDYAFSKCGNVKVEFPDTLTYVGNYAFYESKIENLVFPDSVQELGDNVWKNCASLEELTLPKGIDVVTAFTIYEFTGCTALMDANGIVVCGNVLCGIDKTREEIVVPEGVTGILGYVFSESAVKKVVLPDSVTTISDYAFARSENLQSVEMSDTVTSIGNSAFKSCSSLTELTLSKQLTAIDEEAFASCKALTEVSIPDGVTVIGDRAFASCDSLAEVEIPDNISDAGVDIFDSCKELIDEQGNVIFHDVLYGDWNERYDRETGEYVSGQVDTLYIPKNVKKLALTLPNMKNITLDKNNTAFAIYDDSLYTAGMDTLLMATPKIVSDMEYTHVTLNVPTECTTVANGALREFGYYGELTGGAYDYTITIPPTVENIYDNQDFNGYAVVINGVQDSYANQYAEAFSYEFEAITMYESLSGDADYDGTITLSDAQYVLKAALKIVTVTQADVSRMDVDGDRQVTLSDAQRILKAALKIEVLPSGKELTVEKKDYEFVKKDYGMISTPTQPKDALLTWNPYDGVFAPSTGDNMGEKLPLLLCTGVISLLLIGIIGRKRRRWFVN